jgi:DNA polymerase III subunit delta'
MTRPLPAQQAQWARLVAALDAGRLAHALLLAGPRDTGKTEFAHALASYLLCEAAPAQRPCGECRSCVQLAAGVHPNLLRLAPAEDKRDIAMDDIRDAIERLYLSSHYGQAKVCIIDPADALNVNGLNALLKTVEEPPANTHLLFVAERWRLLPPTLRSRCQIVRFARPAREAAPDPEAQAARAEWGRALADALEGRLSLRIAQGLKRDAARAGLEIWLQAGTRWLERLLVPGRDGKPAPRGATAPVLQQLLDDTLAALRALDRNGNPTLLVESIMIRVSQRAASGR